MVAQLEYNIYMKKGYPGLVFDTNWYDSISRAVETEAGIPFGVAVSRGTDPDNQMILGGTAFIGITIRSLGREGFLPDNNIFYPAKDTGAIMQKGYIWAVCSNGCTAGNRVSYAAATGVLASGAATAGNVNLTNATWTTSAAAGELAVLHLETTASTVG